MPNYERDTKKQETRKSAMSTYPLPPPANLNMAICTWSKSGDMRWSYGRKNDLGIFASLTLNFDISIFKMLSGGRGTVEKR